MPLAKSYAALVFLAVAAIPLHQARRVVTGDTGNYTAPFLVPGACDVHAEGPGSRPATRKGVELQMNAVVRIGFPLTVGTITEIVEVKAGAPLLTTENTPLGAVSQVTSARTMREMQFDLKYSFQELQLR